MKDDSAFYVQALASEECACEKGKAPGKALCYACWTALPGDMQRDLYRPIGRVFEQAYDAAVKELEL